MEQDFAGVKRLLWAGVLTSLIGIAVAVFASWVLYQQTITLLTENLRDRLLTISITAAANIDSSDLDALRVQEDWTKPEWEHLVKTLHAAKYSNDDVVFMYIFRKKADDPSAMEFVADADSLDPFANTSGDPSRYVDVNRDGKVEPDGPDKLQWPGQDYPEAVDIPEAFEAYNGPLTSRELYTDDYGTVLTGYAPIKNEVGETVAVLATDIKADDFFVVTRQTLLPFLLFIGFLVFVIALLATTLLYVWFKRAGMLAKLSADLDEANHKQENLLHFISHEIKGYLTKSSAAFSEILEGDYGQVSDQLRNMAQIALTDIRKGVDTIMSILNSSDLKKGIVSFKHERFNLKTTVSEVFESQKKTAKEKGLQIDIQTPDEDCAIVGDEAKIKEHVIRNLIENAINYTLQGSVHVVLSREKKKVRFSVQDSGVGITSEDMKRLFTEGGHGKNSLKVNVHSTGYGLFIAKQIVETHQGKIWVESEGEGKGSRFFVEFPSA